MVQCRLLRYAIDAMFSRECAYSISESLELSLIPVGLHYIIRFHIVKVLDL